MVKLWEKQVWGRGGWLVPFEIPCTHLKSDVGWGFGTGQRGLVQGEQFGLGLDAVSNGDGEATEEKRSENSWEVRKRRRNLERA